MSAFRRLNVLDERRSALETCGYCPKLCRAACPVSEAETREALIPWGKMTMTWYTARGDLEPDRDLAALPWACTECRACREHCEHKNPVAETLVSARSAYRALGLAPAGSEAVLRRFAKKRPGLRRAARALAPATRARQTLLLGCGYLGARGGEARDAFAAVRALAGDVHVLEGCCGLPFRAAGDVALADAERTALLQEIGGRALVVADAGCALELRGAGARTLAELAASRLDRLGRAAGIDGTVRFHDPCRLARGLGIVDEPRAVLARALGAPPGEFEHRGTATRCSGAGGLLPFTFSHAARAVARERMQEHERLGGGTLVTACASSLAWFRAQGARALDLASVIARSVARG